MRSYDKVLDSLFKDKITELYLSFLLCPFIYYMKGKWSILIQKLLSYFKNNLNSMKAILSNLAYP